MDTYRIQITKFAEEDLRAINFYIANDLLEPETAKKTIHKIATRINTLESMPLRNPFALDKRLADKTKLQSVGVFALLPLIV